ncbi:MAG: hypothetical protein NTV88_03050, partial [Candidatus Micrarchaeota archaeon]|nr:hypothetical protein [Candidatus Micrarchaeota archaeon]
GAPKAPAPPLVMLVFLRRRNYASCIPRLKAGSLASLADLAREHHLKSLAYRLQVKECSMGMSSDWKEAAEEGATIVRIGTAIFGKRD